MTPVWHWPRMRAHTRLALLLALVFAVTTGAAGSDLNEAGRAAYARGDYAAAERLFTQALAQAPDEPLLHYHRGVALMRLSRWQEAYAAFDGGARGGHRSQLLCDLARVGHRPRYRAWTPR